MSHQAIARKFRPQVFEDIVGQQHVTRTLQNAIRLERVHHAFLMTGARGVGKTSAARVLSRALNCEKGPAENPCNECSSCKEMLAGSFPDVIEFDAASHNSVDDIRDLVDKVRYAPQRGRYKVYIIDEVHMVTKQGFNALLKTLEEPPPHVIFILATTDPQQLLDTVISRCQRFDFKMIPVRTTYEHLKFVADAEGVKVPDASMMTIAREGGGSMRDAQSLLDQVLSFAGEAVTEAEVAEILGFIDRSILYDVLEGALAGDPAAALESAAKVSLFGFDVRTFANQLLEAVRNVTVVMQVRDAADLLDLPDNEIARLQKLAQGRDLPMLMQQFDILAKAVDGIARSEQPALLLDMAAVKMASVRPFVPVDALVDRLVQLEKRLAAGGTAPRQGGRQGAPPPFRGEGPTQTTRRPEPAQPTTAPVAPAKAAPEPAKVEPAKAAPKPPRAAPEPVRAAPKVPPRREVEPEPVRARAKPTPAPPRAQPSEPDPPGMPELPPMPDDDDAPADNDFGHHDSVEPPPPAKPYVPPKDVPTAGAVLGRLKSYRSRAGAPEEPAVRDASPPAKTPKIEPAVAAPEPPAPEPPASDPSPAPTPAPAPPPPAAAPDPAPTPPPKARKTPVPAESARDPKRPDPSGTDLCDAIRWRRFVHALPRDEGMGPVKAALATAGFVAANDGVVSLGFEGMVGLNQARNLASHPSLEEAVAGAFGEGTKLAFSLDPNGQAGRTLNEEVDRLLAKRRAALEADARAHDTVQLALSQFEGSRIEAVRIPEIKEVSDVQ
jgi:DNA polymerase III subunit gamma/tau